MYLQIQSAFASDMIPSAPIENLWQLLQQNNAELNAATLDESAAAERANASGALPDPSVRIEWQDVNQASGLTLNPSQVTAVKYSLLQAIPGWGKRDAQKQSASANVMWARAQHQVLRADLRARLLQSYVVYGQRFNALVLNEAMQQFARSATDLAKLRYEQGQGSQQDWLKGQLEIATLRSEYLGLQAELKTAQARLNKVLNRRPDAVLAAPQPLPDSVLSLGLNEADLQQRLQKTNPQLLRQQALTAAVQAEVALATQNDLPDFIVAIAPVQRGNGVNSWDAMVEFTVPLQRAVHGAQRHEASERLRASAAREQALRQDLMAQMSEQFAGWSSSSAQLHLIREQNLPLAEATFNSALAVYQQNRLDFATLWQARTAVLRAKLDELNALSQQQIHCAEIERLLGEPL